MKIGTDLPELSGATEWINAPASREQLLGSPTLVHFWSVSCGVCSEQMPQVNEWREQMVPRGLRMVGIHMPRSEADTNVLRVKEAVTDYGLTHPIAVDNTHAIVDLFANKFVPAFYVFDAEGHLRHYQAGERGLPILQGAIERVLNRTPAEN